MASTWRIWGAAKGGYPNAATTLSSATRRPISSTSRYAYSIRSARTAPSCSRFGKASLSTASFPRTASLSCRTFSWSRARQPHPTPSNVPRRASALLKRPPAGMSTALGTVMTRRRAEQAVAPEVGGAWRPDGAPSTYHTLRRLHVAWLRRSLRRCGHLLGSLAMASPQVSRSDR